MMRTEEQIRRMAEAELQRACRVIEQGMERYGADFPSACATGGIYRIKKNDDWTNGFWTGMLWLAYQFTGREAFKKLALEHISSFEKRLEDHFVLDHHDIGFLYSPSVVYGYKITGDDRLKAVILQAADVLASRFQEKGEFIQAWGKLGDEKEYRLIIDSLLNLPLLYTAYAISGDERYRRIAGLHYKTVIDNIVREDGSTYHTFYFDRETGAPKCGATHQGFSDNSCWARGQAWALLGMPLHARISRRAFTASEEQIYGRVSGYFESHLPADGMPYWDLIFADGSGEPRDSSALAVAACAYLERGERERAARAVEILRDQASTAGQPGAEGLLLHGVYAYAEGKGVDEPNLWGDYFYMEALYRLWNQEWEPCW